MQYLNKGQIHGMNNIISLIVTSKNCAKQNTTPLCICPRELCHHRAGYNLLNEVLILGVNPHACIHCCCCCHPLTSLTQRCYAIPMLTFPALPHISIPINYTPHLPPPRKTTFWAPHSSSAIYIFLVVTYPRS